MKEPRVLSFSANDTTGKTARFTVGTDIIDYMESARAFGREDLSDPRADGRFQRRMVAIPDKKGNVVTPMVLTISNQNELYLVRKDDESKSGDGWKLIDLSQAFKDIVGDSLNVRAHSAAWTEDDRIAIAVAVDDGTSERSRVFVAYDLSTCTSDWENIEWMDCGTRNDVRVEGIRVLDGGDGVWTIVLAGDRGLNDMLYLLRSNAKQSFSQALVFNPAVTLEEILDFEVAVHPLLGCGIAVLGINRGTRDLSFRPFPEYKADGSFDTIPPVKPLPCPDGANVLETGLTRQVKKGRRKTYFGSDIYVGGQGVCQIKALDILQVAIDGGAIDVTVVAPPDVAPNVQDLIVGDAADGSASVWSLLQNGDLNIVKKSASAEDWGNPLRLRVGVQAIAPVHGDDNITTSLLTVYANGQTSFLYKEAKQGLWEERPLMVANPEEVTQVTCYGTTLRVLDESGLPQQRKINKEELLENKEALLKLGIPVKISASVLSSVVVNGHAVFIGPNVSFETQTDTNGSISLYDRVRSLTPAIYRFEVEGFDECIDVNPASGMHERFKSITADELRSATISTNGGKEPLLPENFRTGADQSKVDMLADSLNQLSSLTNSSNDIVTGVSLVNRDRPFSSILHPEVAPDDYRWGIQVGENGVSVLDDSQFSQTVNAGGSVGEFFQNLGDGIADFFEGLGQSLKEGVTFVLHKVKQGAEKAWEFVCKIGNEIKQFFLNTWEEIKGVFEWLWEQVEIGVEKVWEFLKFVFNWEDILRVRDFMVEATDVALQQLPKLVDSIKTSVENSFDSVISKVNTWKSKDTPQLGSNHDISSSATFGQISQKSQSTTDKILGNSAVSWVFEHFQSLADEIIDIEDVNIAEDTIKLTGTFIEGLITDFTDEMSDCFEQLKTTVNSVFGTSDFELSDLSLDVIKSLVVDVGAELIETFFQLTKKLLMRVLDLIKDLTVFVRDILFSNIRFPFIEKLVKLVTTGAIEIDTSFRLVDVLTLFFAIPTTISYKILFGKAPLQQGDVVPIPFGGSVSVQSSEFFIFELISSLFGAFGGMAYNGYQAVEASVGQNGPPSKLGKCLSLGILTILLGIEIHGLRPEVLALDTTMIASTSIVWVISAADLIMLWNNPVGYAAGKGVDAVKQGAIIISGALHVILEVIAYFELEKAENEILSETSSLFAKFFSNLSKGLGASAALVFYIPDTMAYLLLGSAVASLGNLSATALSFGTRPQST